MIMKMKRLLLLIFVTAGFILLAGAAQAATITYSFDTLFPASPPPDGDGPWLTTTFEDGDGVVLLTISGNLTDPNWLSQLYINLDPNLDPDLLTFTVLENGATFPDDPVIETWKDHFQANGDGKYDIHFDFPNPPAYNGFYGSEGIIYEIGYTDPADPDSTIDALSFDFMSKKGGGEGLFYTAAHIQDVGGGVTSSWIGDEDGSALVPIPSAVWLLASGLIAFLGIRRRL